MTTTSFTVTHVQIETSGAFEQVDAAFRAQLGKLDVATLPAMFADPASREMVTAKVAAIAGPIGLCLFASFDHGSALALDGRRARVVQHVVGNPLIAAQMTRHDLRAGLYAPLRVLIWERAPGRTVIEYDLPSSLFGQLGNELVDVVARDLDCKLERVVANATSSR